MWISFLFLITPISTGCEVLLSIIVLVTTELLLFFCFLFFFLFIYFGTLFVTNITWNVGVCRNMDFTNIPEICSVAIYLLRLLFGSFIRSSVFMQLQYINTHYVYLDLLFSLQIPYEPCWAHTVLNALALSSNSNKTNLKPIVPPFIIIRIWYCVIYKAMIRQAGCTKYFIYIFKI